MPVLLLPLLLLGAPSDDDGRIRTFVQGFTAAAGMSADEVATLSDLVVGVMSEDRARVVLGPRDVARALDWASTRDLLGCDSACANEIAEALDVDRLVSGTLTRTETRLHVVLREIDVHEGRTLSIAEELMPVDDDRALVVGLRALTLRFLTSSAQRAGTRPTGALVIDTIPTGAAVTVDGAPRGTTPLTLDALTVGAHAITLDGKGYVAFGVPVYEGGTTTVRVELGDPPDDSVRQNAHDAVVSARLGGAIVEGGCALASVCAAGVCGALTLGMFTDAQGFTPDEHVLAVAGAISTASALTIGGAAAWFGIVDVIALPEAPAPLPAIHRVVIDPPRDEGRRIELPLRDQRAAATAF